MRRLLPIIIVAAAMIAISALWQDPYWHICWPCVWSSEADMIQKGYTDCLVKDAHRIECRPKHDGSLR